MPAARDRAPGPARRPVPGRGRGPLRLHQGHPRAPERGRAPAREVPRLDRPLRLRAGGRTDPHRAGRIPQLPGAHRARHRAHQQPLRPARLPAGAPAGAAPRTRRGDGAVPRRRHLRGDQPARRHEPGVQGVRRRARRPAGCADPQPLCRRRARTARGADRQPVPRRRDRRRAAPRRHHARRPSSANAWPACAARCANSTSSAGPAACWPTPGAGGCARASRRVCAATNQTEHHGELGRRCSTCSPPKARRRWPPCCACARCWPSTSTARWRPSSPARKTPASRRRVGQRLRALATRLPVAIVTGRTVADVREPAGLRRRSSWSATMAPKTPTTHPAWRGARPRAGPACAQRCWPRRPALAAAGVTVEDKGLSIALHYRLSRERERAQALIDALLAQHGVGPAHLRRQDGGQCGGRRRTGQGARGAGAGGALRRGRAPFLPATMSTTNRCSSLRRRTG